MSSSHDNPTNDSPVIDSPPATEQVTRSIIDDSRRRMQRLANELLRTQNRRLLTEFLSLRRTMR